MLLILDYDNTYTADPLFWNVFVKHARKYGHTVVCCTYRIEDHPLMSNNDVKEDMSALKVPIVFAGAFVNKWKAMEAAGYLLEDAVWIDDSPRYILKEALR